jgi:hypothetical protein
MRMSADQAALFRKLSSTIYQDDCTMQEAVLSVVHCLAALSRSLKIPAKEVAGMVEKAYDMPDKMGVPQ